MTDATWKKHPGSNDFNTASNWSFGVVPDGTAAFGTSSRTDLTVSAATMIGGWRLNADASAYTFTVLNLTFTDTGIVIKGGSAKLSVEGGLEFKLRSTAGSAHIISDGGTEFVDASTAGRAHIVNNNKLNFNDSSTAGHAQITNNSGFYLAFRDTSTAGSAVITTTDTAVTYFVNNSTGSSARLITQAGGTVDFSQCIGPAGNSKLSVGSIEGAGNYKLGGDWLFVGGNNRSTSVSGLISDGGLAGGTGAVLDKVGTGTLKLTHPNNTYSLATILDAGTFDVAALGAAGPGLIVFDLFISGTHATLKIENAALLSHAFGNLVFNFAAGDKIDLPGLKFVAALRRHTTPVAAY